MDILRDVEAYNARVLRNEYTHVAQIKKSAIKSLITKTHQDAELWRDTPSSSGRQIGAYLAQTVTIA